MALIGLPKAPLHVENVATDVLFKSLTLKTVHGRRWVILWSEVLVSRVRCCAVWASDLVTELCYFTLVFMVLLCHLSIFYIFLISLRQNLSHLGGVREAAGGRQSGCHSNNISLSPHDPVQPSLRSHQIRAGLQDYPWPSELIIHFFFLESCFQTKSLTLHGPAMLHSSNSCT